MGQKLCLKVLRKSVLLLQGIVIVNWQFKDELFQIVGTFFITLKKKIFFSGPIYAFFNARKCISFINLSTLLCVFSHR